MIITGALFADDVEKVDGKLNVTGGVYDWLQAPLGEVGRLWLVLLLQSSIEDEADPSYTISIDLYEPDGEKRTIAADVPMDAHTGEMRFWYLPLMLSFVAYGRHVFAITVGNSTVSLPLTIKPRTQSGGTDATNQTGGSEPA